MDVKKELQNIAEFISNYVEDDEEIVVPVSGGVDSDVVARICTQVLGKERVRLFIVVQSDMEDKFLMNARNLAHDLQMELSEIHLENVNQVLMDALIQGDTRQTFTDKYDLDSAKAKCSLRSSVISCYQDKGLLIAGTTNRTEWELGFFLTFGDNLSHFKPLAHLYKSQIMKLGEEIGTRREVLEQEPSAGFWNGQTDREDLAYWIINDGPILRPRSFSEEEVRLAEQWMEQLTIERIDHCLLMLAEGKKDTDISAETGMQKEIVQGLRHISEKAKKYKSRRILQCMESRSHVISEIG